MQDVVTLAAKEPLPNIRKEQSPTLIIEGVLGDLTPKVENADIRGIEEEEGWSSTPGNDDHEGDDVDDENQIDDASEEQIEHQVVILDEE